jgi:hypothetical protein
MIFVNFSFVRLECCNDSKSNGLVFQCYDVKLVNPDLMLAVLLVVYRWTRRIVMSLQTDPVVRIGR